MKTVQALVRNATVVAECHQYLGRMRRCRVELDSLVARTRADIIETRELLKRLREEAPRQTPQLLPRRRGRGLELTASRRKREEQLK